MTPRDNEVLARLDDEAWQLVSPHLERMALRTGQLLYDRGETPGYIYFPVGAVVGIRYELPDGNAADVGILERRLCGPLHLVAGGAALTTAVVRQPGTCYRLPLRVFLAGIRQSESLLLQMMQALRDTMHLMSVASVCLRKHPIENLVAVWLLIGMDATRERTIRATHRDIAQSLGVRREAVTLTLQRYAGHGLVALGRGSVELTDPEGLRRWTCSCYSGWGQARGVPPTA